MGKSKRNVVQRGMAYFLRHPNKVISGEELGSALFGRTRDSVLQDAYAAKAKSYVHHIRKKLEEERKRKLINFSGFGWKLADRKLEALRVAEKARGTAFTHIGSSRRKLDTVDVNALPKHLKKVRNEIEAYLEAVLAPLVLMEDRLVGMIEDWESGKKLLK